MSTVELKPTRFPTDDVKDVRTATEIAVHGVIESSNHVTFPLEDFIARNADWPAHKAAKVVTYCGSGHRCTMAMGILWSYGYTDCAV